MHSRDDPVGALPVIAGVDGSAPSLAAVELAVREAVTRGRRLRLVHALGSPYPQVADDWLRPQAEHIVADAWRHAQDTAPDLPIDGEVITGEASTVLRDCSCAAQLVVVGDRGLGGFGDLLIGSVAVQLAAHVAETESDEARLLSEALAGWHAKHPDVVVNRRLAHGGTRKTLIEETRLAQLAVVGSRGRGGFAGLLLGSVSQALLHHAACPVAVIPHPHTGK